MLASTAALARGGGDFLICPDNTIHEALTAILPRSPLPWLPIAEAVAAEAVRRGFKRLGVLGTRRLVDGPVYPEGAGGARAGRAATDRGRADETNRLIMDELVCGVCTPAAVACFQRVIGRMKDAGCDTVVLGCTEIPLIISDANAPLPTLDSTRLLARAALRRAVEGTKSHLMVEAAGEDVLARGTRRRGDAERTAGAVGCSNPWHPTRTPITRDPR